MRRAATAVGILMTRRPALQYSRRDRPRSLGMNRCLEMNQCREMNKCREINKCREVNRRPEIKKRLKMSNRPEISNRPEMSRYQTSHRSEARGLHEAYLDSAGDPVLRAVLLRPSPALHASTLPSADELFQPQSKDPDLDEDPLYSIRMPIAPGRVSCLQCHLRFLAQGPTGFIDDQPICDMCLLEADHDLGLLMALASVTRSFGELRDVTSGEYMEALAELGAFARIYDQIAAKTGPPRTFRVPTKEN